MSFLKQALLDHSAAESDSPQHTCPFCNFTCNSEVRIQMHVASQHSQKPTTLDCPLCRDKFRELDVFENHVVDTHKTKKGNVNKLMALVDKTEWLAAQASAAPSEEKQELKVKKKDVPPSKAVTSGSTLPMNTCTQMDLSTPNHNDLDNDDPVEMKQEVPDTASRGGSSSDQNENDDFACDMCSTIFSTVEDLFCHQNEMGHLQFKAPSKGNNYYLDPNRSFKCEICEASFAKKNALLVHCNTVCNLHRLNSTMKETNSLGIPSNHKATMTAQIDPNCFTVERPDSVPPLDLREKSSNIPSSNSDTPTVNASTATLVSKPAESRSFPIEPPSTATIPPLNSSLFTFPFHPDHNIMMQQASGLPPPPSLLQNQALANHRNRCGASHSSADTPVQHQQMSCKFAQSQYPPLPVLNQQDNSLNAIPSLHHSQQNTFLEHSETSVPRVLKIQHSNSQEIPTPEQHMFKTMFPFLKPEHVIFRHLLEGFGFDVVMQFNENSQGRPRKEVDEKNDKAENCCQKSEQEDKEIQKKNIDMPEINRSVCRECGREFSSIWVLKAHQEETHKDIVPIKALEKFAEEFRKDNERHNTTMSVVDDAANMEETPSPSSSGELSTGASSTLSTPPTPSGATPLPVPDAATPPVTSLGSQMPDVASSVTANRMAAQTQFNRLPMSMNLAMGLPMHMNTGMNMNLPFAAAMKMHPPITSVMMPPSIDPLIAPAFGHSMMPGAAVECNFFDVQQKLLQEQQLSQQRKRVRTIINDDQLKILRAYFDMNAFPTEEQLLEMSEKTGLPLKVIKHWFRNTLFKERQRNKDSPYNFNNPPSTYLNLEEYEKTGEAKITPLNDKPNIPKNTENLEVVKKESITNSSENEKIADMSEVTVLEIKEEKNPIGDCQETVESHQTKLLQQQELSQQQKRTRTGINEDELKILEAYFGINNSPTEEQLLEMSEKLRLPLNVIKDWFQRSLNVKKWGRKAIFKDRQRNRYSPYNFNNPPSSYLILEEYEKNGEAKKTPLDDKPNTSKNTESLKVVKKESITNSNRNEKITEMSEIPVPEIEEEKNSIGDCLKIKESHRKKLLQKQKKTRTRINDSEFKILEAYFGTNNCPAEEQLLEMSEKLRLPLKVIKDWFQKALTMKEWYRKALFKVKQRSKYSPYNFNNPPSSYLNLEEYEKNGEAIPAPEIKQKIFSIGQKTEECHPTRRFESSMQFNSNVAFSATSDTSKFYRRQLPLALFLPPGYWRFH